VSYSADTREQCSRLRGEIPSEAPLGAAEVALSPGVRWLAAVRRYRITRREHWRRWVTSKPLEDQPVHRWFIFPHSFSSQLVHTLIAEWGLRASDRVLDPFVGAGTTLLSAKEKAIRGAGYDLSPLAVLASRVKLANYSVARLEKAWQQLQAAMDPARWDGAPKAYPLLVRRALPGRLLGAFAAIDNRIAELDAAETERQFFRLALLSTLPRFSRAVATGGWLRWVKKRDSASSIPASLSRQVAVMLADLRSSAVPPRSHWHVRQGDARTLPDQAGTYSAVVTSPPYPNRHDYTRVFGVELMFGFLDPEGTKELRYQSFHSHPEAHPDRPDTRGYRQPIALSRFLGRIRKETREPRVPRMLAGYFLDMYLCLKEARRVCKKNARLAVVVGNAQYCGQSLLVDELTAELGEQTGLTCDNLLVARFRGNSAQQMGRYGRRPSRETIVLFRKP